MNAFPEIMDAMNEKKQFFIKFYPEKAREVMRKLGFTPNTEAGPSIVQKRPGYNVILNQRPNVDKGKRIMESTSAVLEERPFSKKRKMMREEED